jgi:hypothetical protein
MQPSLPMPVGIDIDDKEDGQWTTKSFMSTSVHNSGTTIIVFEEWNVVLTCCP